MDIRLQFQQQQGSYANHLAHPKLITFKHRELITIGRGDDCDLTLPCHTKTISRYHARILTKGKHFILTDTSANGTFINGSDQPVGYNQSTLLKSGDILHVGEYTLAFNPKTVHTESPKGTKPPSPNNSVTPPQKTSQQRRVLAPKTASRPIPKDWYTPAKKTVTQTVNKGVNKPQKQSLPTTRPENQYVDELLQGLGIDHMSQHMTPSQMFMIGRCLHTTLKSMIKQREHIEKIKSTLSIRRNKALRDRQPDLDALLKKILDNSIDKSAMHQILMAHHRQFIEDQTFIYESVAQDYNVSELSPSAIGQWNKQCVNIKNKIQVYIGDCIRKLNSKNTQPRIHKTNGKFAETKQPNKTTRHDD